MKIRCVGVVVVMLIFPCVSRGRLWVRFRVSAMYFLRMHGDAGPFRLLNKKSTWAIIFRVRTPRPDDRTASCHIYY